MNFSRKVRFQVAVTVFVALFVVVGLQATSSPASAVNCTTSHCATVEVAWTWGGESDTVRYSRLFGI